MIMKTFSPANMLLIDELPEHLSSAEAQALVAQIDSWFSQSGREGDAAAPATRSTRGNLFYFDEHQTSTTSKDN
jgi:hypothetical protein